MKLNPRYKLNRVAGEYVLLDTAASTVDMNHAFCMNEPAAWLWGRIGAQEFEEPVLVEWICDEYDVDRSVAESDVRNILHLWHQYGMLL